MTMHENDEHTSDTQQDIRARVERRLMERNFFIAHFVIYLLVVVLCWFIYATSDSDGLPWPMIVTVGWGMLVMTHFLRYFNQFGPGRYRRESYIQGEIRKEMAWMTGEGLMEKPKNDASFADPTMRLTDDGELVPDDPFINDDTTQSGRNTSG